MSALRQAFYRACTPPPTLTVSQWADRFRMLSAEASAEPGQWNTDRAPFQRPIMDAFNDPRVEEIIMMSSAQVGKTEDILNTLGYIIAVDPGPTLLIQPTLEMAEAFSKDRLESMLRDTPTLRDRMLGGGKRKSASNTIRHKTFPGGHVTLAGANSPASLASRPIRFVFGDEIDRWEANVGEEGDPVSLARKRTTTFWNRKMIWVSTPTVKGASRIEALYAESDQRQFFVACPHCTTRHVLKWANVHWTSDDPATAHLVCPECGCEISEAERQRMLRDPECRPSAPFRGVAGFHLWEAYSPWRRLADIVADFLEAKKAPDTLQVFINTSLGETWEEQGDQADATTLVSRRERYPVVVPAGAVCLTCGVDTQDDRLEALILGWGLGEECWVIEHHRLDGDPQTPEVWSRLDQVLQATYAHESGAQLDVKATCLDTAGHRTQYAYDYVRGRMRGGTVYAVIGRDGADRPIVSAPSAKRHGKDPRQVPLFIVGTDACKALVYSRLKLTAAGPGYVHLPLPYQTDDGTYHAGVDEEFVAQLTAEKLVTKHRMGVPMRVWIRTRPRNEALDLAVYGTAALRLLRPNLPAMAAALTTDRPAPAPSSVPARQPFIPKRTNWLRPNR